MASHGLGKWLQRMRNPWRSPHGHRYRRQIRSRQNPAAVGSLAGAHSAHSRDIIGPYHIVSSFFGFRGHRNATPAQGCHSARLHVERLDALLRLTNSSAVYRQCRNSFSISAYVCDMINDILFVCSHIAVRSVAFRPRLYCSPSRSPGESPEGTAVTGDYRTRAR